MTPSTGSSPRSARIASSTRSCAGRKACAPHWPTRSWRRAVETCDVRHAVSFHSSISRAQGFRRLSQEFNRELPELPAVASFHVSGKMPGGERAAVLREFAASGPSLLTNARCRTEGVDVPKIDCVPFAES